MARYVFKKQDLEPLRRWLDNPVARRVLKSTAPIKRIRTRKPPIEEPIELPVKVQSRDQPDGVPLHELLQAVQTEMPSVVGISVRGGKVLLKHGVAPKEPERERLRRLIADPGRLTALRPPAKSATLAVRAEDLEQFLLDDETPDAEWLRAFRRYAVAHLIKSEKTPK